MVSSDHSYYLHTALIFVSDVASGIFDRLPAVLATVLRDAFGYARPFATPGDSSEFASSSPLGYQVALPSALPLTAQPSESSDVSTLQRSSNGWLAHLRAYAASVPGLA